MARECMLVRHSLRTAISMLDDAERGRLLTAMLEYSAEGIETSLPGRESVIWPICKEMIDYDVTTYQQKVKKRWGDKSTSDDVTCDDVISPDNTRHQGTTHDVMGTPYPNPNPYPKANTLPPNGGDNKCAKRFKPPTLAEVQSYVAERHSLVEPQEFIDFYASKGWMVGKTPMKDWKAACRNAEKWEKWQKKSGGRSKAAYGNMGSDDVGWMRQYIRQEGSE